MIRWWLDCFGCFCSCGVGLGFVLFVGRIWVGCLAWFLMVWVMFLVLIAVFEWLGALLFV